MKTTDRTNEMERPTYVIDIETLGTRPGFVVATIGLARVMPGRAGAPRAPVDAARYWRIDLASAVAAGLRVDGETVEWWLRQSEPARREVFRPEGRLDLEQVLESLATALRREGDPVVYGKGPSFDLSILEAAYAAVGQAVPWRYWDERCLRTERAAAERAGRTWTVVAPEIPHHAACDAEAEAMELEANVYTAPAP